MKRLLELISNDDGRLSRTQTLIVVCFLFSMSVIVTHIVCGDILTLPMLMALGGLHFFCLVDRVNVQRLYFKFGKDGAHISMNGENT